MPDKLLDIYQKLSAHFGKQNWWPAETQFEVIVGAILTQNTAWRNVEKVIKDLKSSELLTPDGIFRVEDSELTDIIRSAGYYNSKTKKLKAFVRFLYDGYSGSLDLFFDRPKEEIRRELLSLWGIGPETADSILLYAGNKRSFVVDAYTRRIFNRLGVVDENINYDELKKIFEDQIPANLDIYKEFHAVIVMLGKDYCKVRPVCKDCPVREECLWIKKR